MAERHASPDARALRRRSGAGIRSINGGDAPCPTTSSPPRRRPRYADLGATRARAVSPHLAAWRARSALHTATPIPVVATRFARGGGGGGGHDGALPLPFAAGAADEPMTDGRAATLYGLPPAHRSAIVARERGYRTALVCNWHLATSALRSLQERYEGTSADVGRRRLLPHTDREAGRPPVDGDPSGPRDPLTDLVDTGRVYVRRRAADRRPFLLSLHHRAAWPGKRDDAALAGAKVRSPLDAARPRLPADDPHWTGDRPIVPRRWRRAGAAN